MADIALMVNPMTTQDDLIVGGSSGAPARLGKGTDGQVLTVDPSTHHLVWADNAGAADILGLPTAETDTSLVLAPDGAGGVEFRAEAGGGGGGGLVLLESHTAANSSELVFATRNAAGQSGDTFQSDFDLYEIVIAGVVPVTNAVTLNARLSTDSGSTYISTGIYQYGGGFGYQGGSGGLGAGGQTAWPLAGNISNAANYQAFTGRYLLSFPLSTSLYKSLNGHRFTWDSSAGPGPVWASTAMTCASTSAVNAIKFYMSSGNMSIGTIYIYGWQK